MATGGENTAERLQQITYKGPTIIVLDLSNLQDEKEIIGFLNTRSGVQKPHCLLVDLTNTHFTEATVKETKESAKAVQPIIKGFPMVGTDSSVSMLATVVGSFSGMNIDTFPTPAETMDWLTEQ
jgi:hypothetical protein